MHTSAIGQVVDGVRRHFRYYVVKALQRPTLTVAQLNRIFRRNRYQYTALYADDQIITRHNCDFINSPQFANSFRFATELAGRGMHPWSAYLLQWCARQAVAVPGDIVECGTARGFAAAIAISSVDVVRLQKHVYLFDSWQGLAVDALTENERLMYGRNLAEFNARFTGYFDDVTRVWAKYPYVSLIKGFVPKSLQQVEIRRVCFLHLDMNSVHPEVEALRFFWPRLSTGGVVVLDDYGQPGRGEQKHGMDKLAEEIGFQIFASPTGQGLIIKTAN